MERIDNPPYKENGNVMDKYKLTLQDTTHLSNTELAEVYDILLEQAALKATVERSEARTPPETPSSSPADIQVKSIQVSNDLRLEVWPRGGGDDDHPLVTLSSLGQEADGDTLGVVVIWQSEILPLVSALTEAAMILSQSPNSEKPVVQPPPEKEKDRTCPNCGGPAQRVVSKAGSEDLQDGVRQTLRYRCPKCAHTWGVLVLEDEKPNRGGTDS